MIKEKFRIITDSELMFCKNHNFLMYSKTILTQTVESDEEKSNDEDDEEFSSSDNLFEIKNQNF